MLFLKSMILLKKYFGWLLLGDYTEVCTKLERDWLDRIAKNCQDTNINYEAFLKAHTAPLDKVC